MVDVNSRDFKITVLVHRLGACSAGEIARHLGLKPADVTLILHKLASEGVVKVFGNPLHSGVFWVHHDQPRRPNGHPHYWDLRKWSRENFPELWQGGKPGQGKTRVARGKWTQPQLDIWKALKGGGKTTSELCEVVDYHKNTVVNSLHKMRAKGVVQSRMMPDRRGSPLEWSRVSLKKLKKSDVTPVTESNGEKKLWFTADELDPNEEVYEL